MDLALSKIPMEGYACPLETTLRQEETQESIVPDACPDIQRPRRSWIGRRRRRGDWSAPAPSGSR